MKYRFRSSLFLLILLLSYSTLSGWADSDTISRLYNFTPNSTISSSQMNAELGQLVNTVNSKIGSMTNSTIIGSKTFSNNITITATPSAGSHAATKAYVDTRYPTGYHGSAPPVWVSNTTFTVANIQERDSTDASSIIKATSTTCDITTVFDGSSVFCGLDAGSVGNNTFYYLYAVGKTDGSATGLELSTVNEVVTASITMPAGWTYKRQLPFFVVTDGSSHIRPFQIGAGWPTRPYYWYSKQFDTYNNSGTVAVSAMNLVNNGGPTSFTTITNPFLPPIAKREVLALLFNPTTQTTSFLIRDTDGLGSQFSFQALSTVKTSTEIQVGPSGTFDLQRNVGDGEIYIDFLGCVITEVP